MSGNWDKNVGKFAQITKMSKKYLHKLKNVRKIFSEMIFSDF